MGDETTTLVGPVLAIVRSGSVVPVPLLTSVLVVAVLVKFCAARAPVIDAVLWIAGPWAAVTTPGIVTVQEPPPSIAPPLQVTRFVLCVQLPRVLVICSCGGTPMPPTPFNWSVITALVTF